MRTQWALLALSLSFFARFSQAAPANDNFANAEILTGSSISRTTSTAAATAEEGEPNHGPQVAAASIWYLWTAPENGVVNISTFGSNFDTILATFSGDSLTNLISVAANDDAPGRSTSEVGFAVQAQTTYYIAIDGFEGDSGNASLTLNFLAVTSPPPNDNYANAILLTNFPVSLTASNFLATTEQDELTPAPSAGSSVWWRWTPPTNGHYFVSTAGSAFDTILSIYKGRSLVSWNDNDGTNAFSKIRFYARSTSQYHISIQGYRGAVGSLALAITADPPKPVAPWTLDEMNGLVLNSSDYSGKVVVLDFWATWCEGCVEEVAYFDTLQERYAADGLVIIGISTDVEGFSVVRPFAETYGVRYFQTITNPGIEENFKVEFIPSTYIINRDGLLTDKFVGVQADKVFEDSILPLLFTEIPVSAARELTNIVLRWPASSKGYIIQSSTNIASTNWSNLPVSITISGDNNQARIPINTAGRYFRLAHN